MPFVKILALPNKFDVGKIMKEMEMKGNERGQTKSLKSLSPFPLLSMAEKNMGAGGR